MSKYQLQYDPQPPSETCPLCGHAVSETRGDNACLAIALLFAVLIVIISCLALAGVNVFPPGS